MSTLGAIPRSHSGASLAASDTTYHSFRDVDVHEPAPVSRSGRQPALHYDAPLLEERGRKRAPRARRKDSGYGSFSSRSHTARPATSASSRTSTVPSYGSLSPRLGSRYALEPSARDEGAPPLYLTDSRQSCYHLRAAHPSLTFFQFPPPHPAFDDTSDQLDGETLQVEKSSPAHMLAQSLSYPAPGASPSAKSWPEAQTSELPPQTTHYWTSDRTRRLEYAAIDAASRGVKGWVRKHIVPECFVPKDRRHVGFDDDGGSVRRYRLQLEQDDGGDSPDCDGESKKRWNLFRGS